MTNEYNISFGNMNVNVIPRIAYLYQDPRRVKSVSLDTLNYPVAGSCEIYYDNNLGINYHRIQNIYTEDDENYFIDLFGNIIELNIDNYPIKYNNMSVNTYTEFGRIREIKLS